MDHIMSKPAKLCAPLELEAFVDLLAKVFGGFVFGPVQNKHTPQVLQVLHTTQLRDASALHLRGRKRGRKGERIAYRSLNNSCMKETRITTQSKMNI